MNCYSLHGCEAMISQARLIESFHMGVAIQCEVVVDHEQTAFSMLTSLKTSREVIQDGIFSMQRSK
jgi:hypothetical protein